MKKSTVNSRILHIFIVIGILFLCLAVYMSYFELYGKKYIVSNNYNRRLKEYEKGITRGSIYDRNGELLASTDFKDGVSKRIYPYKKLYSHVIGYNSEIYGKSLLEAQFNDTLLSRNALGLVGNVKSLIKDERKVGNNISLTIDHKLQLKARELLGDKRGAIVAINPKTGEILAMVSTPDFNPNEKSLKENWKDLSSNKNSPFLPRAISGLYPPGSTFKVVTGVAAIKNNLEETIFEDQGSIIIDGKTFSNVGNKSHGSEDMGSAMTISSNVYFVQLSELVGSRHLVKTAEKSGINKSIDFDLPIKKSSMEKSIRSKTELAATAIGQGRLLVTPMQMALITSGLANDGVIMKPYLVKNISSKNGFIIDTRKSKKLYNFTDKETAHTIRDMMVEVVKNGTGSEASISGVQVAGKTGTAENEKSSQGEGYDHAWFIGFAPANDPEIAIAVILENQSKGGGQIAAPIARKIMSQWIKSNK